MVYRERTYRHYGAGSDLVSCRVKISETDLYILAERDLKKEASLSAREFRHDIEGYIAHDPEFLLTLKPHRVKENAPAIVREMSAAGEKAGVGPMAAVAGAIAQYVGRDLAAYSGEVIVENGGDIFLNSKRTRKIGIYSGMPFIDGNVVLEIPPAPDGLGICTSSGKIGHSLSFGGADAVVVLSSNAALADAVATAAGNLVKKPCDIEKGITFARTILEVKGVLIIAGGDMGVWGELKLARAG